VLNELMSRAFDVTEENSHGTRWNALIHRALELGRTAGELRADVDPLRVSEVLPEQVGVAGACVLFYARREDRAAAEEAAAEGAGHRGLQGRGGEGGSLRAP
jgi:hypothetical protein